MIIHAGEAAVEPRVLMELDALKESYDVTLACTSFSGPVSGFDLVLLHEAAPNIGARSIPVRAAGRIRRGLSSIAKAVSPQAYWRRVVFPARYAEWERALSPLAPHMIIAHHVHLMPLAEAVARANRSSVILNAHEYYPLQFEGNPIWNEHARPEAEYLCATHLPRADAVITVSNGIADEYRRRFGVSADVVMSTKPFEPLAPSPVDPSTIRLIHHGIANPDRQLENMVDLIDLLDQRFTIDFMLVESPAHAEYFSNLASRIDAHPRLNRVRPVPTRELARAINQYDIGLYMITPQSFNLMHCLPNKFFEFIQARLALVFTPVPEIARLITQYGLGVLADDCTTAGMAKAVNELSPERIVAMKERSHAAAHELSSEPTSVELRAIVDRVISSRAVRLGLAGFSA